MKHAYLIIAHNQFEVLRALVSMIDDERNDIYVHIDKKVKALPKISTRRSRLFFLERRIDVRWGHVSQIQTELLLFETALRNEPYDFYHLISGTHLPLKSQDEIHAYFDSIKGHEVFHIWKADFGDMDFKIHRIHCFTYFYQSPLKTARWIAQHLWAIIIKLQIVLRIRRYKNQVFLKSDNWVSLTNKAVKYLVNRRKYILGKYRWTFCADEYFALTELSNAPNHFVIEDNKHLLYADFGGRPAPRILSMSELDALRQTNYLFARKFTSE